MKVEFSTHDVTINEEGQKTLDIIANDKMFKILSSQIYTNKILAPIRELSTNAYDAHVAAGNLDKPFDVHLPTSTQMYFYIRDYGVGLTKEEVVKIYSTYGMSTKCESDEYVGCLGLGSKSPFAYTKSFTVYSYKDGMCYQYKYYMSNNVPKLVLNNEYETKEANGLKIYFKINDVYDCTCFQEESRRFYQWFKVKPNFIGYVPVFYDNVKIEEEVYKDQEAGYYSFKFLMGNIIYEEGYYDLYRIFENKKLDLKTLSQISRSKLVFEVPIGTFDISVSRESLEQTNKNIFKINEIMSDFKERQFKKSLEEIDKQENDYLKNKKLLQIRENAEYLRDLEYKGLKALTYTDTVCDNDVAVLKFYYTNSNGKSSPCRTVYGGETIEFTSFVRNYDFHLVYIDCDKLTGSNNYKQFINKSDKNNFVIITNNLLFYEWGKNAGIPVKDKTAFDEYKVSIKKPQVYYNIYRGFKTKYRFEASDTLKDKDGNIYYVPVKGYDIVGEKWEHNWIEPLEDYLEAPIYGLRKKEYQLYKNEENFINAIQVNQKIFDSITEEQQEKFTVHSTSCLNKTLKKYFNSGLKLDKSLMKEEQSYQYELFLKCIENENYKKYAFSKKDEKIYEIVKSKFKTNSFQDFRMYIATKFPFLSKIANYYYYSDIEELSYLDDIKIYVKSKEDVLKNAKI